MKFVVISDTHNKHRDISLPEGDVLLHCGDFTGRGTPEEFADFGNWLQNLPYENIVVIPGNHDILAQTLPEEAKKFMGRAHLLIDEAFVVDSIKIWGSPWTPQFYNWAFMTYTDSHAKSKWDLIPDDTDILMTHGPPHGVMDLVPRGENIGCPELLKAVNRVSPKYHLFGHFHGGYGTSKHSETTFVNAATLDERYMVAHKPYVINI